MRILKHSLIILWGNQPKFMTSWAQNMFAPHEILFLEILRQELTGHTHSPVNKFIIKEELMHRVHLRLALGQRVVLLWEPTQTFDYQFWLQICDSCHANLQVITFDQKFSHDKIASCSYEQAHCATDCLDQVLAVGDVHGNYYAMAAAVHHAQTHGMHLIWLGDIVDYGDQNLKCVHLAYQTVQNGAHMIWGNHEKKIGRWIDSDFGNHYRGRLSEANLKTIKEIESISQYRQARFKSAWKFLESQSFQMLQLGDWCFTHGAVHPDSAITTQHRLTGVQSDYAYYGQVKNWDAQSDSYPQRVWDWVNALPSQAKVVVGHDWINRDTNDITVKTGTSGAQVWCMDTGSSKGGHLSALEINLKTNTWKAQVFSP